MAGIFDEGRLYLTVEEYEQIKDLPYNEINGYLEAHVSDDILFGYGYYGFMRFGHDAVRGHYAAFRTGTHCD